jgi:hypothetical protein
VARGPAGYGWRMRAMFTIYVALIVSGLAVSIVVGLSHH